MRTDDIELLLRTVSVNTCTRMGHVYNREIGHTENQLVVAVVKGVVAKPTLLLAVSMENSSVHDRNHRGNDLPNTL